MMPAHEPIPSAQQRRQGQADDLLPLGDWVRHHSLRSWPVLLIALVTQVPLAITLEVDLHASNASLGPA